MKFLYKFLLLSIFSSILVHSEENSLKTNVNNTGQIIDKKEIINPEQNALPDSSSIPQEKEENNKASTQAGRKITEIVDEIEKRVPKIIENRKNFYLEGIRGFLSQFGPELDYISDENQINQNKDIKNPSEFYKPILIDSQKILYIRIDGFSDENFIKLKEECLIISRYKNQPVGIIFDLRSGKGENPLLAAEYASLFYDGDILAFTKNKIRVNIKAPIIIIVSSQTNGAAEVFANFLLKSGKALLIGEKTYGVPFPKYPVKLNSGGVLFLPDIPTDLEWIEIKPLNPSITINPYPQIDYSKISMEKEAEKNDFVIRRACDLLVSIDALHKEKKEK
ncbi:MAG TPA: S41 family peptidase [Victivallales bacterium]|mgnify:FL=1|nr:S41 family peptidase [Victivallales bacterium]HRR06059.1 S41 family peptidase [Victivallales bacterium]HRR27809.1 S41 family peptidase [Victivallales bacterium]HRU00075.1 S41 family peptidase [Victivallales bacterium]